MSKYVQYDLKSITNLELLLAALADLGWDSGKVEVHETPVTLYGYHGDARPEKANIVIRRHNTGIGSSNDIGFVKRDDGTYAPIISEYDSGLTRYGKRDGVTKLSDSIQSAYGKMAGNKAINTITNVTIPAMKAKGLVPRHATVATVKTGKVTQLVLRY
jgi:hypothetical protein